MGILVMRREMQVSRHRDNLQPVCLGVDADGLGRGVGSSQTPHLSEPRPPPPSHVSISLQSRQHPIPPPCNLVSSTFSHALNSLITPSLQASTATGPQFVVPQPRLLEERIFLVLCAQRNCALSFLKTDSPFVKVIVAQSCPTLCDPMDCSPPGSSVHGVLQARILEWVAIPFSRGSS